jgi:hypothetical protein
VKVPIEFTIRIDIDVPDDWDDDSVRFYVEENHCMDNYVEQVHREIEARPGVCHTCHRGSARVLATTAPTRGDR